MSIPERFSLTKGAKKIFVNSGYLFFEKILNMGLSFIVSIYVVRYLGPEEYGLWQYSISLVALIMPLGRLGTTHLAIRDLVLSSNEERKCEILGTVFTLMFITGIIGAIIISFIGSQIETEKVVIVLIIIASTELFFQGLEVFDYWFQSKVLSKYSVLAKSAAQVTVTLLKLFFVFFDLGLILISFTVVIGGIIRSTLYIYFYLKKNESITKWKFDSFYAKNLLKNSWPLIISGLSLAIYMKIDQVMLRNMVSAVAVGNYAVAVKLSGIWYFIPMSVISSVFPSIINSKKDSLRKYNNRLQYLYTILVFIAFIIAVPMTFLSDFLVQFLFGSEYIDAGKVLSIHIWAGIFVFMGVARSKWIINENYQFYGMLFNIIGAVTNVLLNLIFIPKYGIVGAAWATVISQALSAWFLAIFVKETRIAFFMHSKAMLNTILLYPVYTSIKEVYEEAVGN